jgi:uncharacterized protein with HEPN domain
MRDHFILVRHILGAIDRVEQYTEGLDLQAFLNNFMVQDAVIRNLENVGEASRNIPQEFKNEFASVPWKQINGMRNKLIHEYFVVDLETVWIVVCDDLPPLKLAMLEVLNSSKN